jgi:hypothetical protein
MATARLMIRVTILLSNARNAPPLRLKLQHTAQRCCDAASIECAGEKGGGKHKYSRNALIDRGHMQERSKSGGVVAVVL